MADGGGPWRIAWVVSAGLHAAVCHWLLPDPAPPARSPPAAPVFPVDIALFAPPEPAPVAPPDPNPSPIVTPEAVTAAVPAAPPPPPRPRVKAAAPAPDHPPAATEPAAAAAPFPAPAVAFAATATDAMPPVLAARYRRPPAPPAYPKRLIPLGLTGTVVLRALIGIDGAPRQIAIWRSSGVPAFDDSALAAARGWDFLPARHDDRPLEAWVEIPVHFAVKG
jgi:protein TonB